MSAVEIELLALRRERRVLRRRAGGAAWRPGDRLWLTALSRCLPRRAWHVFPVHPTTLQRWHRELVRRRWAATGQRRRPGRPPLPAEARELIVRTARENPRWGYVRIKGELLKLGYAVSATAVRMTLRRCGVPPAAARAGLIWPVFLRARAAGVLASVPAPGRALGTCLLAVWLLRVVLAGPVRSSPWGCVRRVAVARRVLRSQSRGTWSTASAGTPPSASRVSRVWVPVDGGRRLPAQEERRTVVRWGVEAAWRRPGDGPGVLRRGRPVVGGQNPTRPDGARRLRGEARCTPRPRRAGRRSMERADAAGARGIPAPPWVRNRPDPVPLRWCGGALGGRPAGTTLVCLAARRAGRPAVPGGRGFAPCILRTSAGRSRTRGCGAPDFAPGAATPLWGGGPAPPSAPEVGR